MARQTLRPRLAPRLGRRARDALLLLRLHLLPLRPHRQDPGFGGLHLVWRAGAGRRDHGSVDHVPVRPEHRRAARARAPAPGRRGPGPRARRPPLPRARARARLQGVPRHRRQDDLGRAGRQAAARVRAHDLPVRRREGRRQAPLVRGRRRRRRLRLRAHSQAGRDEREIRQPQQLPLSHLPAGPGHAPARAGLHFRCRPGRQRGLLLEDAAAVRRRR